MASTAMTIAAGFQCRDGVVICADTEVTLPGSKDTQSKITNFNVYKTPIFTFAGDVEFSRMCIPLIAGKLLERKKKPVLAVLRAEARQLHLDYGKSFPADQLYLNLLVAVHEEDEKVRLYLIEGPKARPIQTYKAIGTGADYAAEIMGMFYRKSNCVDDAAILSAYLLGYVKRHAQNCGGPSQIVSIWGKQVGPNRWHDIMSAKHADALADQYISVQHLLAPLLLRRLCGMFDPLTEDIKPSYGEKFETDLERLNGLIRQLAVGRGISGVLSQADQDQAEAREEAEAENDESDISHQKSE